MGSGDYTAERWQWFAADAKVGNLTKAIQQRQET
jgi:hypothetical protein